MSRRSRQVTLAVALVALLAVILLRLGGGEGGGAGFLGLAGREPAATVTVGEVIELDLAALERKPSEYKPGRDPFRFQPKPKPPAAPPPPTPQPRQERRPPPARPAQARPQQPAKPQPPPVDVVFLGSFGPDQKRLAVFSDSQEIFNVIKGGVVKEKFIVREIGLESADVGFVGFPEAPPQRLPAGGKR